MKTVGQRRGVEQKREREIGGARRQIQVIARSQVTEILIQPTGVIGGNAQAGGNGGGGLERAEPPSGMRAGPAPAPIAS